MSDDPRTQGLLRLAEQSLKAIAAAQRQRVETAALATEHVQAQREQNAVHTVAQMAATLAAADRSRPGVSQDLTHPTYGTVAVAEYAREAWALFDAVNAAAHPRAQLPYTSNPETR